MTGRDAEREQLAAALPEVLGPVGLRQRAVPLLGVPERITGYGRELLNALLPVVDRIANERAAAELEAAANELIRLSVGSGYNGWYTSWLRARAALRASNGEGT